MHNYEQITNVTCGLCIFFVLLHVSTSVKFEVVTDVKISYNQFF